MAQAIDSYARLAGKIGSAGYPRYIKILENQLTSDEAELAVELAEGVPPSQIAQKMHLTDPDLNAKIDDLVNKRVILKGNGVFRIPRDPRFFPHGPATPRTKELWMDFFHSGDYPKVHIECMKERTKLTGKPRHKVTPARQALRTSPGLNPQQILWYEDYDQIFNRAAKRWQGGLKEDGTLGKQEESGCGCRRVWSKCDYTGGCTGWDWKPGEWGIVNADRGQASPRPARREISVGEALAAMNTMENNGMVHISPNSAQITGTCNCCPCCCEVLHAGMSTGQIHEILAPSRYRAVIDLEKCSGCQTCVERCHFNAIEMKKSAGSKKVKAYVTNEGCFGCGLCVFKCPSNAITLELCRTPDHIPTTPFLSPNTLAGNAAGKM